MGIVKKESSSEQIINYILEQIAEKKLNPGDKLMNERAFSELLGVSRIPLREAVAALSILGILEARQGDGTYVKHYDPSMLAKVMYIYSILDEVSMQDMFEVRATIESQAAALAARRATGEQVEHIRQELESFDSAVSEMDELCSTPEQSVATFLMLNRFHRAVAEASGNRFLSQFMDSIGSMAREYYLTGVRNAPEAAAHILDSQEEHREIYRAIVSGNDQRAGELAYRHLLGECATIQRAIENMKE